MGVEIRLYGHPATTEPPEQDNTELEIFELGDERCKHKNKDKNKIILSWLYADFAIVSPVIASLVTRGV